MVCSGTASYQGRTGPVQRRGACGCQAAFSQCPRTIGQTSELVVGAQGRDQPCYCRKVVRAKGGRVADLAGHPREISRRPRDRRSAFGEAGVERLILARQRDEFDTLTACCWRGFRLTLGGLGVYLHKTDDEWRNARIVDDLGGITHVVSSNWFTGCNSASVWSIRAECRRALSQEGGPGHSAWWQGLRHPDCSARKRR